MNRVHLRKNENSIAFRLARSTGCCESEQTSGEKSGDVSKNVNGHYQLKQPCMDGRVE